MAVVGERPARRHAPAEMAGRELGLANSAKRRPLPLTPVFARDPIRRIALNSACMLQGLAEIPGQQAAVDTGPGPGDHGDDTQLLVELNMFSVPLQQVRVDEAQGIHCAAERHGRADQG